MGKGSGFGKTLVDLAERFAVSLGVPFVVLSALPHVVAYYHKLGYGLVDREGRPVDVAPWVEVSPSDGRERLVPERRVHVSRRSEQRSAPSGESSTEPPVPRFVWKEPVTL